MIASKGSKLDRCVLGRHDGPIEALLHDRRSAHPDLAGNKLSEEIFIVVFVPKNHWGRLIVKRHLELSVVLEHPPLWVNALKSLDQVEGNAFIKVEE